MAETSSKAATMKEDYSSILTGLRKGYAGEMAKMENWAGKERNSIETHYIEGGRRSGLLRDMELEELDTLQRLNAIRIAKHYFDEARYHKGNVISRLDSAKSRKALINAALEVAKGANFPEEELTEFNENYRLAEEEESALAPVKEALETLEKEMYAHAVCQPGNNSQ